MPSIGWLIDRSNYRIRAAVVPGMLLACLLASGASILPLPTQAQTVIRSAQSSVLQQQVRQGLASVEQQGFNNDLDKQVAKAKVLVSVTGASLAARAVPPAEAIMAIGVAAISTGIPAPIVVATVSGAAFRSGVVPPDEVIADTLRAAIASRADGANGAAAVIVAALDARVAESAIGQGLSRAASSVWADNPAAAASIAQAVADEGTAMIIGSFSLSVANAAGSAQLASIANGPPRAAATGGGGGGLGGLGGINNLLNGIQNLLNRIFDRIGLPPPCITPSCS